MAKQSWKGSAQLSPVPCVLVSSGSVEKPNVFTVGWTGIINSQPPKLYVSIRPERYSYELIKETRELVVNLPTSAMVKSVDFCGVKSGRDMDKFAELGLIREEPETVSVPGIRQLPLTLECRVIYRQEQIISQMNEEARSRFYPVTERFPQGDVHTAYYGQILNVYVIEE